LKDFKGFFSDDELIEWAIWIVLTVVAFTTGVQIPLPA
jgi:hypothetical protein